MGLEHGVYLLAGGLKHFIVGQAPLTMVAGLAAAVELRVPLGVGGAVHP